MKTLFILIFGLIVKFCNAQPNTEVYVFDLNKLNHGYSITNPKNVSNQNPGYDNQPHFSPNGESLYYASTKNGQTDVAFVELSEYSWEWLTKTEGSEYSRTPIPDGSGFSAIRLEKDGTQLLYKYPTDMSEPHALVPGLKIGYHCWFNESIILAFVLGEPVTLQSCDLKEGKNNILQHNIGRSLHKIPGKERVSYVSKEKVPWMIKELDPFSGSTKEIITAPEGSEDIAWTPDGAIIIGHNTDLYKFKPGIDSEWIKFADLSAFGLRGVTRIAVSPKGNKIAIVVNE